MDRVTKAINMKKSVQGAIAQGVYEQEFDKGGAAKKQSRQEDVSPEYFRENRIIAGFDDRSVADSYKLLRTRLLRTMKQNGWKTIGVTSADNGVGKTTTASNLAIAIAMETNHSALLVDADLRKPDVQGFFGVDVEYGLNDYLKSDIDLAKLLVNPGINQFNILPCQRQLVGTSELLTSKKMARLVEELKTRYADRIVIFDLPPILVGDDVVAFSALLDCVLLVVEDGKTQTDELMRARDLLEEFNLLGVVFNKSKDANNNYGNYYQGAEH